MNYIMIKYENEEFWIEIDKENYSIRQIIISGDNIEISCTNDCLAEGKIYLYELDGDITKIDKEKFDLKWKECTRKYFDIWRKIKLKYPIGSKFKGNFVRYHPNGAIFKNGVAYAKKIDDVNYKIGDSILGEVCDYDEPNMWFILD